MFVQKGIVVAVSGFTTFQLRDGKEKTRQTVVIEYEEGSYKKRIAFEVNGDAPFEFRTGEVVDVALTIDASEYNGKWYSRIRCCGIVMSSYPSAKFPYRNGQPESERNKGVDPSDFNY